MEDDYKFLAKINLDLARTFTEEAKQNLEENNYTDIQENFDNAKSFLLQTLDYLKKVVGNEEYQRKLLETEKFIKENLYD